MKVVTSPIDFQNKTSALRESFTVGFVPTMGGLHDGHMSLIDRAKKENDICIVSLFLNPTQFNNQQDLQTYPASMKKDLKMLREKRVNVVFTPSFDDIYPDDYSFQVIEKNFSKVLCGKDRPGHFEGVLTVVLKLLMLAQPNRAYFGEKDYQQLKLIENLVKAFFIRTEIVPCPVVRNDSGLALSSRNKKLSVDGMKKAEKFAEILNRKESIINLKKEMESEGIEVDYLEEIDSRRFGAAKIENVRLIDNVSI